MIESFTIQNYMCFREKTELSFLASKKEGGKKNLPPTWYKEINGKRILRLLICIGLNGSGKSKMCSALRYLRDLILIRPSKPYDKPVYRPFLLDEHSQQEPTELSIVYYIDEICYQYNIKISRQRIEEEELLVKGNRVNRIFYRQHDELTDKVQIIYGNSCDLSKTDRHDLEVNTLANSTVLSVYASLNLESKILSSNIDYFENHISYVKKSDKSLAEKLKTENPEKDEQMKRMILLLLKDIKTNICDYVVEESTLDISVIESQGAPEHFIKAMRAQYPSGKIIHKDLRFVHETSECKKSLPSELESYGTMSIIRLLVVMFDIILGKKTTTLDELESGIHTKALELILKMYLSLARDCQLVLATHNLQLLNADFLRRDAVRIFQKEATGSVKVDRPAYIHNTINFYKWYLNEVAPDIDKLLEKINHFDEYEYTLFEDS